MIVESVTIGIDLGGTNLKVAVVDRAGRVLSRRGERADPNVPPDHVVDTMVNLAWEAIAETGLPRDGLAGAGIGVPGPLDRKTGRILRCANLPLWVDVPLREMLEARLRCPIAMDNDANAAAWGEFWSPSALGATVQDLVLLTLGTGVGGGVILGGRVHHGHFDNAGEIGHMIMQPEGRPCPCGQNGCLEQYASASAIARHAARELDAGRDSVLHRRRAESGTIDAKDVEQAARAGDALALRIWDQAAEYLAVAIVNVQHIFNPERVLLGGGLAAAGAFLLDAVVRHTKARTWRLCNDLPRVTLASLGNNAGVIGAAALAWQKEPGS